MKERPIATYEQQVCSLNYQMHDSVRTRLILNSNTLPKVINLKAAMLDNKTCLAMFCAWTGKFYEAVYVTL